MTIGYFGLVLHGHIPWCKMSGTWPAGEEWLFEAMNETYLPMLDILRDLKDEGLQTKITINITPILAEGLADEYMKERFSRYMDDLIQRAKNDIQRFENNPQRKRVAEFYLNKFETNLKNFYEHYYRDVLGTFKWLQDEQMVELITCGATHGFLPLFEHDSGIFSQIETAVETHKKYFGKEPKGIWLPECAYRPKKYINGKMRESLDYWLNNSGIMYFFVESHGILDAQLLEQRNKIGLDTRFGYKLDTGVCVFGRNKKTSKQVWDAKIGYPGDESYREFHKKDYESGLNYWKITGKQIARDDKEIYEPREAAEKVDQHATHFYNLLEKELDDFYSSYNETGLIVSPYDFELYGHWWMEGIDWLKSVFKLISKSDKIEMITYSEFLEHNNERFSVIQMEESSWGEGGHYQVWKNNEHGWIWPYINSSIKDLEDVLSYHQQPVGYGERLLKQTARELILMEGSDWPFLLYTKQAKEYANQRFHNHHQRFNKLIWASKDPSDSQRISENELKQIETIDSCFPHLNLNNFRKKE